MNNDDHDDHELDGLTEEEAVKKMLAALTENGYTVGVLDDGDSLSDEQKAKVAAWLI